MTPLSLEAGSATGRNVAAATLGASSAGTEGSVPGGTVAFRRRIGGGLRSEAGGR
jgi:hypothetical protein